MQISLTPELEQAVQAKVESGLYRDETDVVYAALRRFLAGDGEDWPVDVLRKEIAIGAAQLEAGHFSEETILDIALRMEKSHSKPL